VTGAGGGIGRAIAITFAQEGAKVAILDRDTASAEETLALVTAGGGEGIALACDVSNEESVEQAAAAVRQRQGPAHVLVNCVGVMRRGPLESLSFDDWNAGLAVNLSAYFLCSQIFGRAMHERREGVLVHVSSIQGTYPSLSAGAYSTAKAGVDMLSRQLAAEWGPHGIRSNAVHPAWVHTPMSAPMYARPGFTEQRAALVPCRRIGLPEDTAQAVLFLASDRAAYVNGAELLVDGGLGANLMSLVPRAGSH
jgi:glucose 1-dehydrogenase